MSGCIVINPNATLSQVLMRVRSGVTNYYVYGFGLLYEVTETATNSYLRYYHYDYRGSTVALTDGSGNVTDRFEYSAYGTLTYRSGNTDTPFLYNGRFGVQTDPNGLLYMRARYYNPYICRFINPDPIGFSGGLNWYAYADGNPIRLIDPFGLCAVEENGGASWLSLIGNGLNNTVSAIGQSMGQGLYDLYNGFGYVTGIGTEFFYSWENSRENYVAIADRMYSVQTPENPAATPYVAGAVGVSAAAVTVAAGVGAYEAAALGNQSIMVEGVLGGGSRGSGGLLQLRVPGQPPIIRFDFHPIPGRGGNPVLHIDSPLLGWHHWPW